MADISHMGPGSGPGPYAGGAGARPRAGVAQLFPPPESEIVGLVLMVFDIEKMLEVGTPGTRISKC